MKDLFGKALYDHFHKTAHVRLLLHNEYGPPEVVPVDYFFYGEESFPEIEVFALELCRGKVIDLGAATGRHAVVLQDRGVDITALDRSPNCGKLMKERGINRMVNQDMFAYRENRFDTIYMLMNGIGVAGSLEGLQKLLRHLKALILPHGQVIVDSTDISYIYDKQAKPAKKYYGELSFRYEYQGMLDDPFSWLYIDQQTLIELAHHCGWNCQVIYEDDSGSFLARLNELS